MSRIRIFSAALAAALLVSLQFSLRRMRKNQSRSLENVTVPQKERPTLFQGGPLDQNRSIRLLSAEQMSEADRNLEAEAESSVAEHAGFADIAFNEGKWSYTELVCPAFPNHMFLRFTRNNGANDVSVFSASCAQWRGPGAHHSHSAPRLLAVFAGADQRHDRRGFNRIRSEEQAEAVDWVGMAFVSRSGRGKSSDRPFDRTFRNWTTIDSMGPVPIISLTGRSYPSHGRSCAAPADGVEPDLQCQGEAGQGHSRACAAFGHPEGAGTGWKTGDHAGSGRSLQDDSLRSCA